MEMNGQLYALAALLLEKDRRLGGPQSQCWCYGEERNFFPSQELSPDSYVTKLIGLSLFQMSYPGPCAIWVPDKNYDVYDEIIYSNLS